MLRQHAAARWLLPPPPGHPPRGRRYPSCILVTPRRRMLRPLRMMPILLPGPRRRSPPQCGERGVRPRRRAEPALAKGCSFGSRFPDGSRGFHRREHNFPWAKTPSGAQGRQEEPRAQSWEPSSAEHLRGCRTGGCAGCGDAGDEQEMETPPGSKRHHRATAGAQDTGGKTACSITPLFALLEAVGEALLQGRLGTARAGRSPASLSLPEEAEVGAELFQEMLQRDFGLAGEGRATGAQEPGAKGSLETSGLPQRHGAQPGEAAGESGAADSTRRAKSTRWRSGWQRNAPPSRRLPASTVRPPLLEPAP
ncbi:uncharacterized protein LOC134526651 [Chroicocephalus ridibundus]|uniref:uncharacterized protein LOC134526651 n=1 Tax=Chroicocephalus ridibundus TaxID=1192867 RepID=UPI002FDEDA7E